MAYCVKSILEGKTQMGQKPPTIDSSMQANINLPSLRLGGKFWSMWITEISLSTMLIYGKQKLIASLYLVIEFGPFIIP